MDSETKVLTIHHFPAKLLRQLAKEAEAQKPPVTRNNWIIWKLQQESK